MSTDELLRLTEENKKLEKDLETQKYLTGQAHLRNIKHATKLAKIKELLNQSYLYSQTSIFESNLKDILGDNT